MVIGIVLAIGVGMVVLRRLFSLGGKVVWLGAAGVALAVIMAALNEAQARIELVARILGGL